jgi:putative phage-type endonuclease
MMFSRIDLIGQNGNDGEHYAVLDAKSSQVEQRTPAWFKQREGKITGSAVGAILGVNPYKKPAEVMRDMIRSYHGIPNEFKGNSATEWGTACEQLATDQYEMFYSDMPVVETGFHVHPVNEWLGASPDGLLGDKGLIEIKCPYGLRKKDQPEFKTLAEQPHYQAQVQIQLFCTGREYCDFFQWTPNGDQLETEQASEEWVNTNIPKLQAFYDEYLIERELPNAEKYLEETHMEQTDPDIATLVERYSSITDQCKELESMKKELLSEIIEKCGDKPSVINGHKLTKVERKGSIDYKKVPELKDIDLEAYRKEGSNYWKLS